MRTESVQVLDRLCLVGASDSINYACICLLRTDSKNSI